VFFDSLQCVRCLTELAVTFDDDGRLRVVDVGAVRPCANRPTWSCNWTVASTVDGARWCQSCVIVDAGRWVDDVRMVAFQAAQRRALFQLTALGIPWGPASGLKITFRSSSAGDAAVIGHRRGEITLDLDEADPAQQEEARARLGELYRTPLGHLRHELGHFVWEQVVAPDPALLGEFRTTFGDETLDYATALDNHYARVDDGGWRDQFVSFYASAHPWEDFAESWAHLMHVHDVVETGAEWGVGSLPDDPHDADAWLSAAVDVTIAANELARAMGVRDPYPFTLSPTVRTKIGFCWRLIR
jgi:hypothetical protein